MPYIKIPTVEDAEGRLKRLYDNMIEQGGYVANIIQLMSLDEKTLTASIQFYMSLMKTPNALEAAQKEMLAAVVSNVNECFY